MRLNIGGEIVEEIEYRGIKILLLNTSQKEPKCIANIRINGCLEQIKDNDKDECIKRAKMYIDTTLVFLENPLKPE